jgi:PilZ domain
MPDDHLKPGRNGHGALSPVDRRTYPRYHFCGAAEALDGLHRTRMSARTSDIGKGGCYVDTFSPFPLKTPVKIRITREKLSFTAEARVVASKIGMGMGLAFTSIDPHEMSTLDKWLGELSGSAPLEMSPPTLDEHLTAAPRNGLHVSKETGYVLNELIIALMRKGTLTDEEGKTMLLRLLHRDFLP